MYDERLRGEGAAAEGGETHPYLTLVTKGSGFLGLSRSYSDQKGGGGGGASKTGRGGPRAPKKPKKNGLALIRTEGGKSSGKEEMGRVGTPK